MSSFQINSGFDPFSFFKSFIEAQNNVREPEIVEKTDFDNLEPTSKNMVENEINPVDSVEGSDQSWSSFDIVLDDMTACHSLEQTNELDDEPPPLSDHKVDSPDQCVGNASPSTYSSTEGAEDLENQEQNLKETFEAIQNYPLLVYQEALKHLDDERLRLQTIVYSYLKVAVDKPFDLWQGDSQSKREVLIEYTGAATYIANAYKFGTVFEQNDDFAMKYYEMSLQKIMRIALKRRKVFYEAFSYLKNRFKQIVIQLIHLNLLVGMI